MRTNTSYNLATASKATGRNKGTILKAIQSGRISASRDELGGWCIEPAELHRVYPPINPATAPATDPATSRHIELPTLSWSGNLSNWGNLTGNAGNRGNRDSDIVELAALRARLADARDEIVFLRQTQIELNAERAKLTALLTDQRPARRPWWRRRVQ